MSQDNNIFTDGIVSQGQQGLQNGPSQNSPMEGVSKGDLLVPYAVPIYSNDLSPASPVAQSRVDQLIDHVNGQIEILAFDFPEPFLLRQMVQCLVDPRRATRLNLVESFSQIGETATPFLVEGIANHAESVVRRACCNALTNIGDPQAIPVLVKALLEDADTGVKSAAAGALSKVGAPAFDALRAVLASDEASESCKGHAAWAIATMSSEVSERLYRSMSDPSASVRTAVIGAIAQLLQKQIAQQAQPQSTQPQSTQPQSTQPQSTQPHSRQAQPVHLQLGEPQQGHLKPLALSTALKASPRPEKIQKALTILTEALNDQSSEVRIEAAASLARLNCQKAYQPLIACLRDPVASVRKAAALALAKLGNPNAIEAIAQLQRDSDSAVQRVAAMVVEQLEAQREKLGVAGR